MGNDFLEGNYDSGKEDGQVKEDSFQAARVEAWAERLENEKRGTDQRSSCRWETFVRQQCSC